MSLGDGEESEEVEHDWDRMERLLPWAYEAFNRIPRRQDAMRLLFGKAGITYWGKEDGVDLTNKALLALLQLEIEELAKTMDDVLTAAQVARGHRDPDARLTSQGAHRDRSQVTDQSYELREGPLYGEHLTPAVPRSGPGPRRPGPTITSRPRSVPGNPAGTFNLCVSR